MKEVSDLLLRCKVSTDCITASMPSSLHTTNSVTLYVLTCVLWQKITCKHPISPPLPLGIHFYNCHSFIRLCMAAHSRFFAMVVRTTKMHGKSTFFISQKSSCHKICCTFF